MDSYYHNLFYFDNEYYIFVKYDVTNTHKNKIFW
jgi:hypothetical protein